MKVFLRTYWPVLAIVILWFAFSSPYFVKGRIPFPSSYLVTSFPPWNARLGVPVKNSAMPDVISQIYPWKQLTVDSWKQGNAPLWNPFSFAGTGHAANYQSAIFSPLTILFFILPFIDAWSFLVLLQPLVAGLGMYFFLRERNVGFRTGSFIGSIAFMFCGFMVGWMAYGTLSWAAAMIPWICLCISRYFTRHMWFAPMLSAVGIAFSFVSGHFQISLYVLSISLIYTALLSFQYKKIREGLFVSLNLLLGLAIAAPQLLLTYHAYAASVRSASFIKGEVIPWKYIVTLFSPDFYGNPVTRNDWFGHYAEWASYIGIIPLLLAFLSFVGKKTKEQIFFAWVFVVTILLAYQSPLSDLLFFLKLPAISTSAASRILILTSFSLAFLSAAGWRQLQQLWNNQNRKSFLLYSGGVLCVIALVWTMVFVFRPFDAEKLAIAKRNLFLPTGISLLSILLIYLGYLRSKTVQVLSIVGLVLLTMFDLYRFSSKWMPFDSRSYVYPNVASLEYLKNNSNTNRVFGNIGGEVGTTFGIQLIEGYDAMYQKRYGEFLQYSSKGKLETPPRSGVQFDKHGVHRDIVLQLLGVRYIYHRKSDARAIWAFPFWEYEELGTMKQVYADEDYWIYEYTETFPRVFLAGNYVVKKSDKDILQTLFSGTINLRNTIILEEELTSQTPHEGSGSAQIMSYTPNKIEIKTSADSPKLLFLSDVYDEGWIAVLDGNQKVNIHRADYDFRAVEIPSGTHMVEFQYRPKGYRYGIWIALGSVISLILISVSKKYYENRHR